MTLKGLLTLVSVSLLLQACDGGKGKKTSIHKNQKATGQQQSEWAADQALVGKDEKGKVTCFKLPRLIELVDKLGDSVMVVHPTDLSFGAYSSTAKGKGVTEDIYQPLSEDLTSQKANYFLKGAQREVLLETGPAKDLSGSAQVGHLLNVGTQQGCEVVTFKNGERFNLEPSKSRMGVRMISANGLERRAYTMVGKGHQIQITVTRLEKNVPDCGTGVNERIVRRSYLVGPASEVEILQVKESLADLITKSILAPKTTAKSKASPADQSVRGTGRGGLKQIPFATWNYARNMVETGGGKLKDVTCSAK